MLENVQNNFSRVIDDTMNDESGVSVRKSNLEPSALSSRSGAKGGGGWGDFDSIIDEADRYFVDEDDANRFFSVFKLLTKSSQDVAECNRSVVKSAEEVRAAPDTKTGNDEIFYKQRVRAQSVDYNSSPFDSTPMSATITVARKTRRVRPKGTDVPVEKKVDHPVAVRRRSKSSGATVPDKIEPLEGHRRDSRSKHRSPRRRQHRSISRDAVDEGELASSSNSPITRERRRHRERSHSRSHRRHRSSSRAKEEDELIKLTSAVMLGKVPLDSLAAVTAERQRKLLERASKRGNRRHQSVSPVPGGKHD
jgi:hypothetical protein